MWTVGFFWRACPLWATWARWPEEVRGAARRAHSCSSAALRIERPLLASVAFSGRSSYFCRLETLRWFAGSSASWQSSKMKFSRSSRQVPPAPRGAPLLPSSLQSVLSSAAPLPHAAVRASPSLTTSGFLGTWTRLRGVRKSPWRLRPIGQPLAERYITCSREQSTSPYSSFCVRFVGQLTLQLCRRVHVFSDSEGVSNLWQRLKPDLSSVRPNGSGDACTVAVNLRSSRSVNCTLWIADESCRAHFVNGFPNKG